MTEPRDFLAEAKAAPDAETCRQIFADAQTAGHGVVYLNEINQYGRQKASNRTTVEG